MSAPANYGFLQQELRLFVCLQAPKKLHSAPLKPKNLQFAKNREIERENVESDNVFSLLRNY